MKIKKYLNKVDCTYGIPASSIRKDNLVLNNVPVQLRDEIPTMNKMGYMKVDLDEYISEFIEYAKDSKELVLEIGCAYGMCTKKLLESGGRIIANDLSEDHLAVLLSSVKDELKENLYIYPGDFPDAINLPESSISAILTSRVFHFFDVEKIEKGMRKIHDLLVPGGKIFFVVVSPYHNAIKDGFLEQYKKNVKDGVKWPGEIENQWKISPEHKDYVPQYLYVFDVEHLEKLMIEYGFKIEKVDYFSHINDPIGGDKGHVGCIARK